MRNTVLGGLLLGACLAAAGAIGCKEKDDPEASGTPRAISTSKDPVDCGKVVCRAGRACCNESCGICTEPDVACSAQICKTGEGVSALAPECGGSAKRPCPGDGSCIDAAGDACDPSAAGCGGTCECQQSAKCRGRRPWT